MAKPGAGKKSRELSKHSRAARRATDIDIDTDKSLKNVKPPTESVDYRPSVLQAHHGSGISKKTKRGRQLSSRARKRQEKGQDMAEAVMDRTETKREKSKGQSRAIQARAKGWEEVNKKIPEARQKFPTEEDAMEDESDESGSEVGKGIEPTGGDWWETDADMGVADAGTAPASNAPAAPAPTKTDDDDEIL